MSINEKNYPFFSAMKQEILANPEIVKELYTEEHLWPEFFVEIESFFKAELSHYDELPPGLPVALALNFLFTFGGLHYYLPRGHALEQKIKTYLIQREFNGQNKDEIIKKFRLTERSFYEQVKRRRSSKPYKKHAKLV